MGVKRPQVLLSRVDDPCAKRPVFSEQGSSSSSASRPPTPHPSATITYEPMAPREGNVSPRPWSVSSTGSSVVLVPGNVSPLVNQTPEASSSNGGEQANEESTTPLSPPPESPASDGASPGFWSTVNQVCSTTVGVGSSASASSAIVTSSGNNVAGPSSGVSQPMPPAVTIPPAPGQGGPRQAGESGITGQAVILFVGPSWGHMAVINNQPINNQPSFEREVPHLLFDVTTMLDGGSLLVHDMRAVFLPGDIVFVMKSCWAQTSPVNIRGLGNLPTLFANHISWPQRAGPGVQVSHGVVLSTNQQGPVLVCTPGTRVLAPLNRWDVPGHHIFAQQTAIVRLLRKSPLQEGPFVLRAGLLRCLPKIMVTIPQQRVKRSGEVVGFTEASIIGPGSVEISNQALEMANLTAAAAIGSTIQCDITPEAPFISSCAFRASNITGDRGK